jgi:hypothetical protein
MAASIKFDDSHWPLIITRLQGAATDEQCEEYLARGTAYLQRGELYVSIIDMSQLAMPTAAQRQRQTEWLKEHEVLMRQHLLGCALIVTSPLIRLVLSTTFHIIPMPTPHVVVQGLAEAVQWTTARLAEAGLREAAERIRHDLGAESMRRSG